MQLASLETKMATTATNIRKRLCTVSFIGVAGHELAKLTMIVDVEDRAPLPWDKFQIKESSFDL